MKRALALILALTLALALPGCGTAAADYTVLTADPVSAAYDGSTEPAQTALAGFGENTNEEPDWSRIKIIHAWGSKNS